MEQGGESDKAEPPSVEKMLDKIYRGHFVDCELPKALSNSIKVFLSSTTKDYRVERDFIIESVYTELREYFRRQCSLDLTLIDLRWGIRRDDKLSNITTQFCIDEINKCLEGSIGPAFISFLSHRYGTVFLRETIEKTEFERIIEVMGNGAIEHGGVNLVKYCYQLDENGIGAQYYKLKSKQEIIDGLPGLKEVWSVKEKEVAKSIRIAVISATGLSEREREKYSLSVTEEEIIKGILDNPRCNETSLALFRNIEYSEEDKKEMAKKGYLDKEQEYQGMLQKLRNKVENNLNLQNKHVFKVDWSLTDGLNKGNKNTRKYLEQLKITLLLSLSGLIQSGIQRSSREMKLSEDDVEIVHHASFCKNLLENFIEREEYWKRIEGYVKDDGNRRPFIIYGPSGSGKSSIMANALKKLKGEGTVVAVRFMGTSRLSSNIHSVLKSLIYQFSKLYDLEVKETGKGAVEAKDILFNKILKDGNTIGRKVVILLDSIDQLNERDYSLTWLDCSLPENVKVIYSTLPEHGGILQRIKERMDFNKNYVEVSNLEMDAALEQLKRKLETCSRDLQPQQWKMVKSCLIATLKIYPLNIKLLFDITVKWKSTDEERIEGCSSINETIGFLFKRHELHFGQTVFSHFVFYLTIFKNGVSESELEDILSLDDQVLSDVFEVDEPPVRRFPNSILVRLLDALKDYLTWKQSDDQLVLSWFHRSFFEASRDIYKKLFESSKERDGLLQNTIDYFMDKWREDPKEYEWKERDGRVEKKKAPRYTRSQEMRSSRADGSRVYNKRKLNEFPNLVLLLNNDEKKIEYLMDEIYLNYQFMHSRAKLQGFHFVIDTHPLIEQLHDRLTDPAIKSKARQLMDISIIYVNQFGTLSQYPDTIPFEVISRVEDESVVEKIKKSIGKEVALIPTQIGILKSTNERALFVQDDQTSYIKVHWMFNSPYSLVQCTYNGGKERSKFQLINYSDGKHVEGIIEIPSRRILCSFLNKAPKDVISDINELDGGIIYGTYDDDDVDHNYGERHIFVKTFQNDIYKIKESKEGVKGAKLLRMKSLLIGYNRSFEILNFDDYNNPRVSFLFKSESICINILDIKTTSPGDFRLHGCMDIKRGTVLMPEHDSVENTVLCVMFTKSFRLEIVKIKIFNFDKTGIKELFETKAIPPDFEISSEGHLIDRYFESESILSENRLDAMKSSKEIIRMVVCVGDYECGYDKGVKISADQELRVINVFKKNENEVDFEVIDIIQDIRNLLKEEANPEYRLRIFDFVSNILIFGIYDKKGLYAYIYRCICMYDTKEKKVLRRIEGEEIKNDEKELERVSFLKNRNKIIFTTRERNSILVYDVDTSVFTRYSRNYVIEDFRLLPDNTLIVACGERVESIQFDGRKENCNENGRNQLFMIGYFGHIYGFIDEEHLVVDRRGVSYDDPSQIIVLNARDQQIFHSVLFNVPKKVVFNQKMIIVMPRDRDGHLKVYSIKKDEGSSGVEIAEIDNRRIEWKINSQCQMTLNNPNQFLIHEFNKREERFEIRKYELIGEENRIERIREFIVKRPGLNWKKWQNSQGRKFEDEVPSWITPSEKYLVYLDYVSKKFYDHTYELNCVNIETGESIHKSSVSFTSHCNCKMIFLKNEDDFIIYATSSNSFTYCKINSNCELVGKEIELDEDVQIRDIGVLSEKLFYIIGLRYTVGLCYNDIHETSTLNRIHSFEEGMFSMNSNYLTHLTYRGVLKVFKLNNLREEVLTLHVHARFETNVMLNDKYLAIKLKSDELVILSFNGSRAT